MEEYSITGAVQSPRLRRMKPRVFFGLVDCVVNVFLPGEALADSDTQVLAAVYYRQCMAMNMVVGHQDLFLVGADSDAYVGVEFHLPGKPRLLPISRELINLPGGGLGLDLTCL